MNMKSYRVALIPRRQGLYRDCKKPIEHFLRVLLKEAGARIQRLEEANRYVYVRLTMPEGIDAQRVIDRVKRESAAALYVRLEKAGRDVSYGIRADRRAGGESAPGPSNSQALVNLTVTYWAQN